MTAIPLTVPALRRGVSLATLGIALAWVAPATNAAVGAIPGQFRVTTAGAATYSIPLDLPPGINDLTPHLGLAYSSTSGNGLAGYGWTLAGFSTISRCPNTLAEDGNAKAVTFTADDRFCLDGDKLRLKSGTYGADGATYRTEHASFARITSHTSGGIGTMPATGPQWFSVETQAGLTYEYGKTADSEITDAGGDAVRVWALNRITDKYGNFISFEYADDTNSSGYRPIKVSYTGNGSLAPTHTITFSYEALPSGVDATIRYVAGTKIAQTQRLATIAVDYQGSLVHRYTLSYQTSVVFHSVWNLSAYWRGSPSAGCRERSWSR